MRRDNRIIVDLSKVQWARPFYRNQHGQCVNTIPAAYSIRMCQIGPGPAHFHPDYPGETEIARAKRLDLLDVWTPVLRLKLTANEYLEYTGERALSLRDAWNAKIFGKEK